MRKIQKPPHFIKNLILYSRLTQKIYISLGTEKANVLYFVFHGWKLEHTKYLMLTSRSFQFSSIYIQLRILALSLILDSTKTITGLISPTHKNISHRQIFHQHSYFSTTNSPTLAIILSAQLNELNVHSLSFF